MERDNRNEKWSDLSIRNKEDICPCLLFDALFSVSHGGAGEFECDAEELVFVRCNDRGGNDIWNHT